MREKIWLLGLCAALVVACSNTTETPSSQSSFPKLDYPVANRGGVVDNYHGVEVADPYR